MRKGKIKSIFTDAKISREFVRDERRKRIKILRSLSFREKAKIMEELIDFGREILKAKRKLIG